MPAPARLLSVNVGRPRTVAWRGREVTSAIWKDPVDGRRAVRRLNVDGDAQADLVGHGGEHRAVFVYQAESYRHWERRLGRTLARAGAFGENLTVDGLGDDEVCIGDRYAIGTALFEVTQPRVTCYKVGIRLDEPRMPALLTGEGRPGFYLRVLREGEVGAGDPIVKEAGGRAGLTVAQVSRLLYQPGPDDAADLERAVGEPALSEGWRGSLRELLEQAARGGAGNPGLTGAVAEPPAWPGFRRFRVQRTVRESASVRSLVLAPEDGGELAVHRPGQFVPVRLAAGGDGGGGALVRSYSLSAPGDGAVLRISVKREGRASTRVHDEVRAGDVLELGAPRGTFVLGPGDGPVVLVSAGVGATPVLAMLGALARERSPRQVTWIHVARSSAEHPFADEARRLLAGLPRATAHVRYTRPEPQDVLGRHFDATGRLTAAELAALPGPPEADAYVCGPVGFMEAVAGLLAAAGLPAGRIHTEAFGAAASATPGRPPHLPEGAPDAGPLVSFARSGIAVRFGAPWASLLELAEACDVPASWSCRTGVCHRCESGLISGTTGYDPEPLDVPPPGTTLLCCARPEGDVTLDL